MNPQGGIPIGHKERSLLGLMVGEGSLRPASALISRMEVDLR
jgi:hypothetical protein